MQSPVAPSGQAGISARTPGADRDRVLGAWPSDSSRAGSDFRSPQPGAWKLPSSRREDGNCFGAIYLFILYHVPERIEKGLEIALYKKLLVILAVSPQASVARPMASGLGGGAEPGWDPGHYVANKEPAH